MTPTYRDIRTTHFALCAQATRYPAEAKRIHRAILRVAARKGARQFTDQRYRAALLKACMVEARVPMFLPGLFAPILMELLKLLLPIVIQWIVDMLGELNTDDLFSANAAVDRDLQRWAEEMD